MLGRVLMVFWGVSRCVYGLMGCRLVCL